MQLDTLSGPIIGVLQAKIRTAKLAGEIDKGVDESVAALQIYGIYHSTLAFYLNAYLYRPDQPVSKTGRLSVTPTLRL